MKKNETVQNAYGLEGTYHVPQLLKAPTAFIQFINRYFTIFWPQTADGILSSDRPQFTSVTMPALEFVTQC